jgi:ParB family transcriptional regulator, chromosome partitioning protein
VAITIATASTAAVRQALNDAYEKGDLRGRRLIAVQRLIAHRSDQGKKVPTDVLPEPSSTDLAEEYERQTQRQRALLRRAAVIHERLSLVATGLRRLFTDERLNRLLRSEGLDSIPKQLATRIQ